VYKLAYPELFPGAGEDHVFFWICKWGSRRSESLALTRVCGLSTFPSSSLLSNLELSDTKVYGPWTRALLGAASHF